jgi:glycosyltransferase involved in cell wall biosynthesis
VEEFARADYIMVPSQFAVDTFIERGFPPEKMVFQPQGVDLSRFQPEFPGGGIFRVLFVGLLGFRKGLPYLLEAWERLKLKNAELVLVGTAHEEIQPCLSRYRDLPGLKVEGFTPDPAARFSQSTVFCFPSLSEGGAKVTYEAMAAGLPLVVTPEAGSVARDGLEGIIIPPRQVEPIMAALEHLYRHPEETGQMGRRARARAEEFTWQNYGRRLVDFYHTVLGK